METSHAWFVLIDGERHGPLSLHVLQSWAATGALNGEADVSETPEGPWRSASSLPELELDWQVIDASGNTYYPCHILALRGEVEDGSVDPFWQVRNLATDETYQVVDALCSALLIQTRLLEEKLAALRSGESPIVPGEETPAIQLLREHDLFERDATKWKRLYDGEVERNQSREIELQQQIEELRGWQRKATERIKALERRRTQLEEIVLSPRKDAAALSGDPDLKNAYGELKVQMDRLLESLDLRTRQCEEARAQSHDLDLRLRKEREEVALQRERELASQEETLRHLSRLEQAHGDLTRSYRNLNDKMVRLRSQIAEPERGPLHRQSPAPAAAPAADQPVPPSPGRVKIKLT